MKMDNITSSKNKTCYKMDRRTQVATLCKSNDVENQNKTQHWG